MKPSIWTFCLVCHAQSGEPCKRPNGKARTLHAKRVPMLSMIDAGLILMLPCGAQGTQIAIALESPADGRVLVSKWSAGGGFWMAPSNVSIASVLGYPAAKDPQKWRAVESLRDAALAMKESRKGS